MAGISVIICSRKEFVEEALYRNIKETIGSSFEIIIINNSQNTYSIFEAYNEGLKNAKYSFNVFIHEDVLFHTQDWGKILLSYFFEYPEAGLIGVAGSKIKTRMPSGWWETNKENLHVNILQHYRNERVSHDIIGFKNNDFIEVAVTDGAFLALRKETGIKFNETLHGFHNYDTSLSIDVNQLNYKVFVTNKILIEHFSTGMIDANWIHSTYNFYRKYRKKLSVGVDCEVTKEDEEYSLISFIYTCLSTGEKLLALRFYFKLLKIKPISRHHLKILKLLFSSKKAWIKI